MSRHAKQLRRKARKARKGRKRTPLFWENVVLGRGLEQYGQHPNDRVHCSDYDDLPVFEVAQKSSSTCIMLRAATREEAWEEARKQEEFRGEGWVCQEISLNLVDVEVSA